MSDFISSYSACLRGRKPAAPLKTFHASDVHFQRNSSPWAKARGPIEEHRRSTTPREKRWSPWAKARGPIEEFYLFIELSPDGIVSVGESPRPH